MMDMYADRAWAGLLVTMAIAASMTGMAAAAQQGNTGVMRINGMNMLVRSSQCAYIANLSQYNPAENAILFGYPFTVAEEMVLPNATRVSINGVSYAINATHPALFGAGAAQFNVSIAAFSHSPTLQWVTLRMCGELFTPILPVHVMQNITSTLPYSGSFNVSYYRSADIVIRHAGLSLLVSSNSMANGTAHAAVSLFSGNTAVEGYSLVNVYGISAILPANAYALVTDSYPCSINSSAIEPFSDSGHGWHAAVPFTVDRPSCTVSFSLPQSYAVALYYRTPAPRTAAPASVPPAPPTYSSAGLGLNASAQHMPPAPVSQLPKAQAAGFSGIAPSAGGVQPAGPASWLPAAYLSSVAMAAIAVALAYGYSGPRRRRGSLGSMRNNRSGHGKLYNTRL